MKRVELMPLRFRNIPKCWKSSSARLRALVPDEVANGRRTEEHDTQVELFRDHIGPRLVDGAVAFAIPNGGRRHPKVGREMKAEGVTAGVPDVFLLYRGQVFFLEIKKDKGGQVSKEQRAMIARLAAAGATCAVANGLAQAIEYLESWQLLKPIETMARFRCLRN